MILTSSLLDTCLGPMIAIAHDKTLYLLEFVDRKGLDCKIERLGKQMKSAIVAGRTPIIDVIEHELNLYFNGTLQQFKTPLAFVGSPFQKIVWQELQKIPYGQTCSYAQLAQAIGRPSACRAVAQANAANPLPIIVPCHRVINANGNLGGYSGGSNRKIWLINRERQ